MYFSWLGEKAFNPVSLTPHCSVSVLDVPGINGLVYAYPRFTLLEINVPRAEVKQACQAGVAGFDTKLLEPERQKR